MTTTVRINTRSLTSALRDFATLLETGSTDFVIESLRGLADRVEQMAVEQIPTRE